MDAANLHATAVLLGDRGVLILGRSGAGKTTLGLALVETARLRGRLGLLVSDDQLLLRPIGDRLLVEAPPAISGMAEIYGLGPTPIPAEPRAVIDLLVSLVADDAAPRFQEGERRELAGVALPVLELPERNVEQSLRAVLARLGL